jgi:hypothetical protein
MKTRRSAPQRAIINFRETFLRWVFTWHEFMGQQWVRPAFLTPSLRAKRSNPSAMKMDRRVALRTPRDDETG